MRETAFAKCRCDQRQQVVAERDDNDNQGGEQRTARDASGRQAHKRGCTRCRVMYGAAGRWIAGKEAMCGRDDCRLSLVAELGLRKFETREKEKKLGEAAW